MEYVDVAAVILAAGKGTRMKSDLPKVLHKINSKNLIDYVIESAMKVVGDNIHVVVGHQAQKVKDEINKQFNVVYAFQEKMLGTGDAVEVALAGLPTKIQNVLVLNGDVPFVKAKTLLNLINMHKENQNAVTLLTVEVDDPTGYGRILQNADGDVICIKEEVDATFEEKKVKKVNSGIYCFDREFLEYVIPKIEAGNSQEEYYLTDVMEIAINGNKRTGLISADDWREVAGINTLVQLERAKTLLKDIDL
ncbi:MAG: NTP transferase domain-containing protein [Desulfobacteraceae bacterium]|nr:NTP transferase domain-containing protein [Desulfobacteraceae bacterium]